MSETLSFRPSHSGRGTRTFASAEPVSETPLSENKTRLINRFRQALYPTFSRDYQPPNGTEDVEFGVGYL